MFVPHGREVQSAPFVAGMHCLKECKSTFQSALGQTATHAFLLVLQVHQYSEVQAAGIFCQVHMLYFQREDRWHTHMLHAMPCLHHALVSVSLPSMLPLTESSAM